MLILDCQLTEELKRGVPCYTFGLLFFSKVPCYKMPWYSNK